MVICCPLFVSYFKERVPRCGMKLSYSSVLVYYLICDHLSNDDVDNILKGLLVFVFF